MKIKTIYSSIVPFKGYLAMTVWPWIFVRKEYKRIYSDKARRHETTHALQQLECLLLPFFVLYVVEYLIKLPMCLFNHSRAYHSVSFEQEAYEHEDEIGYNNVRHHYAWVKYVFKLI